MQNLLEGIKRFDLFRSIPDEQLSWLLEKAACREYQDGDYVFKKGDPVENLYVVVEGQIVFKFEQQGQFRELARAVAGDATGTLPFSRAKESLGFGVAVGTTRLLCLHKTHFREMVQRHYELTEALVHILTSRVREFTKSQQQNEKLMALGKLSAGLAHELNNPAAAVVRSAAALRQHLGAVPEKFKRVMMIRLSPQQVDAINDILFAKIAPGRNPALALMQRTALEDELAEWMESHDIQDGSTMAETLVEFGFGLADLDKILHAVSSAFLAPALEWFDNVLNTEKLVVEIEEASKRIGALVSSVKSYSHMDQAPDKQWTELRIGIDSTLTMLRHELKKKNIQVKVDFPDDLPKVKAFVGELNQVWTNLIDNAIAAMEPNGQLQIVARRDREFAVVSVIDNGHGIPEEIQSQIFDPFFTTKKMDEGTGLGLDIVQRIMRNHNAEIKVKSSPGRTEFTVCLPIQ